MSRLFNALTGNDSQSRDKQQSTWLSPRKRGSLGMRHLRMEPLECRTLLSFTATINQFPTTADDSSADPTTDSEIHYQVVFGSAVDVDSFTKDDIALSGTGTASVTNVAVSNSGTDTIFDVTVTATGNGTVIASLAAGKVSNAADSDTNATATSTDNVVTYDAAPTVDINRGSSQSQYIKYNEDGSTSVTFLVTFSQPMSDFSTSTVDGDTNLSDSTAFSDVSSATITVTKKTDWVYEVTVSGMDQDGVVKFTCPADEYHDKVYGNENTESSSEETVTCDNTAPTVTVAVKSGQSDPIGGLGSDLKVYFQATFSEALAATPDASYLTITQSSGSTLTYTTVTVKKVNDTTYDFILSGFGDNQEGTLTATINATNAAKIKDNAGNSCEVSTGADNAITVNTRTLNTTVVLADGQASETTGTTVNYTVTFNSLVTDFTEDMITVDTSSTSAFGTGSSPTITITEVSTGSNSSIYTVSISGMNQDGNVKFTIDAEKVSDEYGNENPSAVSSSTVVFNEVLTVSVAKYAGEYAAYPTSQKDPTNSTTIYFTVKFSEAVTSFTAADITLSGTATGMSVGSVTSEGYQSGTGTWDYLVAVTGMTGDGTVKLTIAPETVEDATGETNSSGSTASVTYDGTAPTVTIEQAASQSDPVSGSASSITVYFTATFSEAMNSDTITSESLKLTQASGGDLGWTSVTVTKVNDKTYTFAVTGFSGTSGTLVASMLAGRCADKAGNLNVASTSTDNKVTVNVTPLTATVSLASGQAASTTSSTINFKVVFSSAVSSFTEDDISTSGSTAFAAGASPSITITKDSSDSTGRTYSVAITGMNQDGIVQIQVPEDAVSDSTGDTNTASATISVTYDRPLTVLVEMYSGQYSSNATVQNSPSNADSLYYVVSFSEPVASFDASNITLSGTATGMTVSSVTYQGYTTYTDSAIGTWDYLVKVTGMATDGTVKLAVLPNAVKDASGETNAAGATCSITWDGTAPTVTVEQSTSQSDPVSGSASSLTVYFTATFSEAMNADTGHQQLVDLDPAVGRRPRMDKRDRDQSQ